MTISTTTQQLLQKHWNNVDELIVAWRKLQDEVAAITQAERSYRTAVFELKFPDAKEGTNSVDLGNGYTLKCTARNNYTLANKNGETEAALDAIAKVGNEGGFLADRLVRWSPELAIKEYRSLAPEYKVLIDKVLTIKPGMPSLEIIAPEVKG